MPHSCLAADASFPPAAGPYRSLHFLFKYEIHKKTVLEILKEKNFFFSANGNIQTVRQDSQKSEKAHFISHKKKKESIPQLYLTNGGMSQRAKRHIKGCEHKALLGMVKSLPISQNMFLCLQRAFKLIYLKYVCLHIQRA